MKNTVYVVQYSDYDTHHLVGVFSTLDKAEEAKNKYEKRMAADAEKSIEEMKETNAELGRSSLMLEMRNQVYDSMRKKCSCLPIEDITIDNICYPFNYEHLRFDTEQL